MRRSRRSSRVAPAPPDVVEKAHKKTKPRCISPRSPLAAHIRAGAASTPVSSRTSESPPLFENESPLRDCLSPILFQSTQDGSRGENHVIWDYDSPSSKKSTFRFAEAPLRPRNGRVCYDFSPVSRISTKKKQLRQNLVQKNFLDAMNEELAALREAQLISAPKFKNESEESNENKSPSVNNSVINDIVEEPKDFGKCNETNSNMLKSDDALSESDNFMNELLIEATQKIENNTQIENKIEFSSKPPQKSLKINHIENASDKQKKHAIEIQTENFIHNDTLDNLLLDINDSFIEGSKKEVNTNSTKIVGDKICQPVNTECNKSFQLNITNISNLFDHDSKLTSNNLLNCSSTSNKNNLNDSKSKLSRHSSMPMNMYASPEKKPKYSGGMLSRHNSMPSQKEFENNGSQALSVYTSDEIKRKHQAAKEKLLLKKREVVRSDSTKSSPLLSTNINISNYDNLRLSSSFKENKSNNSVFQTICNETTFSNKITCPSPCKKQSENCINKVSIQEEIERKRKEALERLQRKRLRNLVC